MKIDKNNKKYPGKDLESMANARNYYNWIVEEYEEYIQGKVVEVGAGSGTFSKHLLGQFPKELHAIEPSEEMYPILQAFGEKHTNVTTHNGFLVDHEKTIGKNVNTFFYINVMEHVENDIEEMKLVYSMLKKGGHICIYVPALQWLHGCFDEQVGHYRRYSKKELENKLEQAGFEVTRINYSDIVGIIPWFISFKVLRKKVLTGSSVNVYDKFIIPQIKILESFIKPPIGKNLWAVGVKK